MLHKEEINHVFQPVVSIETGKIIGYEALLRHRNGKAPLTLFETARDNGLLTRLDMLSIEKVVQTFRIAYDEVLFLNIFPTTLLTPRFPNFLKELLALYHLQPQHIILEINEAAEEKEVWNEPLLKQAVHSVRKHGFRIAIDDVGSGAASLKQVIEFEPDIIKLDRYFSHHLATSEDKQAVLTFFVNYCSRKSYQLVLEGVEQSEDFEMAKKLNVQYVQGFYSGKPRSYIEIEKMRKGEELSRANCL